VRTPTDELLDALQRYQFGDANREAFLADAVLALAKEVKRLDTELEKLKRQSRQTASIANCLANGIQPD
jgi:hypothetical protein